MNQQPIVIKQGMSIWGAIGWLLFFGLLLMIWKSVNQDGGASDVFIQTVATLEAPQFQPQPGAVILATSTPFSAVQMVTATPDSTATAYPTYTAVPVQTFSDYGLPVMGPYTLEQVEQCRQIISGGNLNTMKSPQRELCEMYTK